MENRDIVIVGAGIIGLSIAWQLARRSGLKITVLEKGAGIGEGSTGASSAICRHRYTLDDMVLLARDGINAYRNWQDFTRLSDPAAEFHNEGVLWMPGDDATWADQEHERMNQIGIATEVLDSQGMAERFPALNNCTITPDTETGQEHECNDNGRNLFEVDGGYVDPVLATQDLLNASRAAGVDVRFRAAVDSVSLGGGKVSGVKLASGDEISAPLVVNAAGPWCMGLYQSVELDIGWPLDPVRIQIVYRDRPPELEGHIPITADMGGGIYFRTQNRGAQLLVGSVLEEDEEEVVSDPDQFQTETDHEFEMVKLHLLHHRLPTLSYSSRIRGYCGLYTVNRADQHPILGPTPVDGLWAANGFSGHGFKLAPAVGGMLAAAITGNASDYDPEVGMDLFSFDRQPIKIDTRSALA
ncbi:MAG: FAD-dependent oxidoreductase [Xanthomonadales bacterium]|nr:FAD-dependent oxidoreductase [Xanthomonadales bacterium]